MENLKMVHILAIRELARYLHRQIINQEIKSYENTSRHENNIFDDFTIGYLGGFCDGYFYYNNISRTSEESQHLIVGMLVSFYGEEKGKEMLRKFCDLLLTPPEGEFSKGIESGTRDYETLQVQQKESKLTFQEWLNH